MNIPADGSKIIFDRVPPGSFAEPGDVYAVTVKGNGGRAYVRLRNIKTGAGTFDRGYDYRFAAWRYVE